MSSLKDKYLFIAFSGNNSAAVQCKNEVIKYCPSKLPHECQKIYKSLNFGLFFLP